MQYKQYTKWRQQIEIKTYIWAIKTPYYRLNTPKLVYLIQNLSYNESYLGLKLDLIGTYLSRYKRQIRSLCTFNFFETIFLKFSILVWGSTRICQLPPVVGVIFKVISLGQPHPAEPCEVDESGGLLQFWPLFWLSIVSEFLIKW